MLDSVIKLIEKISEFLNYRAERQKSRFKELIEPMYEALKAVHKDYLLIFENCKKELESGQNVKSIADALVFRRIEAETERRAILQQADTLMSIENIDDYKRFFSAVVNYFSRTPFSGAGTPSNLLRRAISRAAEIRADDPLLGRSNEELLRSTEMILSLLRSNWEFLSAEYAKALARSIG